jgi:phage N-6-adenine-methyltransferase
MVSISTGKDSEQSVGTPRDFLDAVESRWGKLAFDLAASVDNAVVPRYYDEQQDSLKQDWSILPGLLWLNPEFKLIEPWVKKASETVFQDTFLCLLPAGFRTQWFKRWCKSKCNTIILEGYFQFVGHDTSFPKDLMLLQYPLRPSEPLFDLWNWRSQ